LYWWRSSVFVIVVALQPSDCRVERTTTIAAPVTDVSARVNDFHMMGDDIDKGLAQLKAVAEQG